ncbi:MAG: ATP-binding protein [Bacilli bacterium]|nr:ATP-binding protein [Bacilli bacterium]
MLGRIIEIVENQIIIKLDIDINNQTNLINLHVILEDDSKKIVGEIVNVNQEKMSINIVGEIKDNKFLPGISIKPSFKSKVRIISLEELELMLGKQQQNIGETFIGFSNVYQNYRINVSINELFSNHFAILGNSGSGKSCTVASIFQKLFLSNSKPPLKSSILIFDAYGEYTNAFASLRQYNPSISYKTYTTNTKYADTDIIKIPLWLLDVDDLALLLDVTTPNQLPIIEKTLKLVPILVGDNEEAIKNKNDIIARALEDILLSGQTSTKIRDQIVAILTKFHTNELNLETQIIQPGYVRTLKQCLFIDKSGKFQEIELVTEFVRSFINHDNTISNEKTSSECFYTLKDLEEAMDFALISEGILKSEKVYDLANVLSVRLHALADSESRVYFEYDEYINRNDYVRILFTDKLTNNKAQIVNFNINYVDDRMAKVITKIISKMVFSLSVENNNRGNSPFHIIVEEAHRYIQRDRDIDIIGYNIFERITKEGRKYGVFLGVITQRPSELSDTVISQCSNFIVLRTRHPKDLNYIREMVPNISIEIVQQLKGLQPGNCIAFGSAFKVPVVMHVEFPNPAPNSNNVDLETIWYQ